MTSLGLLETAFNKYLALDPEAPEKLTAIEGKVIAIAIKGPNRNIYLSINNREIQFLKEYDTEPDATIIGSPAALFRLGIHQDAAPLFFAGEVEIRGDTRIGRQFKSMLTEMEIDWEEYLSRMVGDMAAHRISGMLNELREWTASAYDNFANDVGEYLQEETRDVVGEAELGIFYQQVDNLRDDTERLKARIDRLQGISS